MSQINYIGTNGYALTNDHPQIVGVGAHDDPRSQSNHIGTYGYALTNDHPQL